MARRPQPRVRAPLLSPALTRAAESAIDRAFAIRFEVDPLLGPGLSGAVSACMSSVKRSGQLLEQAIAEALERSDRYIVLQRQALALTMGGAVAPHVVDLIAIDVDENRAILLEIKRGFGRSEHRKRVELEGVIAALRRRGPALLEAFGYKVQAAEAYVVDYWGRGGWAADVAVTREGLDGLFGVPVVRTVDAVDAVMRRSLHGAVGGAFHRGQIAPPGNLAVLARA